MAVSPPRFSSNIETRTYSGSLRKTNEHIGALHVAAQRIDEMQEFAGSLEVAARNKESANSAPQPDELAKLAVAFNARGQQVSEALTAVALERHSDHIPEQVTPLPESGKQPDDSGISTAYSELARAQKFIHQSMEGLEVDAIAALMERYPHDDTLATFASGADVVETTQRVTHRIVEQRSALEAQANLDPALVYNLLAGG